MAKKKKKQSRNKASSNHYEKSRSKRDKVINKCCNGDGNVIASFMVDKKHKDGIEMHMITDTGIIIIRNYYSGKLITKLVARPNQIKRYYDGSNESPPKWLLDIAEWHESLHYNH